MMRYLICAKSCKPQLNMQSFFNGIWAKFCLFDLKPPLLLCICLCPFYIELNIARKEERDVR